MKPSLKYLFFTFLKIGSTSWGGFMSLISVIQKQMGEKDKAIEEETIVEGISLASVLPGPVAVNIVTFIGYRLRGIKGAIASFAGILLPCFLFMLGLSYIYLRYGNIPAFTHFFQGVLPAVAAIIVSVGINLWKKNVTDKIQTAIALIAFTATVFSKSYFTTLLLIACSGFIGWLAYRKAQPEKTAVIKNKQPVLRSSIAPLIVLAVYGLIVVLVLRLTSPLTTDKLLLSKQILFTFSSISLTQFGGGYVVIPSMQKIIVDGMHWLNTKEFTDAIAMGQLTPGPIFISATFIGFKLQGIWGAILATLSIFIPASAVMIFCSHFITYIRNSAVIKSIFRGLSPAVTGMIMAASVTILRSTQSTLLISSILFIASLFTVIRFKMNPVYLIPLAGIAGLIIFNF